MSQILDGTPSVAVTLIRGSISPAVPVGVNQRLKVTADATTSAIVEYSLDAENWLSWPPGIVGPGLTDYFWPRRAMFARVRSLGAPTFVRETVPLSDYDPPYALLGLQEWNGSPWEYPSGGDDLGATGLSAYAMGLGEEVDFLNVSGSGLVSDIEFVVVNAGAVFDPGFLLQGYYDGHTTPDFSVPLEALLVLDAVRSDPSEPSLPRADVTTALPAAGWEHEWIDTSKPLSDGTTDNVRIAGTLRWPMRFSNGLRLTWKNTVFGGTQVWTQPHGRINLPRSWNADLRFYATRSVQQTNDGNLPTINYTTCEIDPAIVVDPVTGANACVMTLTGAGSTGFVNAAAPTGHVGAYALVNFKQWELEVLSVIDAIHARVAAHHIKSGADDATHAGYTAGVTNLAFVLHQAHVFLSRGAGKKGYVASMMMGMHRTNGAGAASSYLEGNVRFKVNGETYPSFESSGTEDCYKSLHYFEEVKQRRTAGCVQRSPVSTGYPISTGTPIVEDVSAYRNFVTDLLPYRNGITGIWPNLGQNVNSRWTTVYYEFA